MYSERTPTTGSGSATTKVGRGRGSPNRVEHTPESLAVACAAQRALRTTEPPEENIFAAMLVWARDQVNNLEALVQRSPHEDLSHVLHEATMAISWVLECGDAHDAITFNDCCNALRLSVGTTRRVFKRYCAQTLSSTALAYLREYVYTP